MSRPLHFVLVDRDGLAPYVAGLRALEQSIRYPIADGADHFHIDHGPDYHPFFSTLGEAFFLIALDGDQVAGAGVGVRKEIDWCGQVVPSFYICDLKVAPEHRGRDVVKKMVLFALAQLPRDARLRRFKVIYGAAMRGARGDVMRSARGLHPMRVLRPAAKLRLYFTPPEQLARLSADEAPRPPRSRGVDLSPRSRFPSSGDATLDALGIVSTAGRKDLRLESTGAPWPLVHLTLGPSEWGASWGTYLASAGAALLEHGLPGPTCFAIDDRLGNHVDWLAARGIEPGAVCTVYSFALPPALPAPPWVHLATSEI